MLLKPDKKVAQIYALFFIFFLALGAIFLTRQKGDVGKSPANQITSFDECVEAGYPIQESYPRGCNANGQHFTEDIGNVNEMHELITVQSPLPNDLVTSPLEIRGAARGTWFFEATFPIVLVNWDGLIIAEGYAEATENWMAEEYVPYRATLEFENPGWEDDFSKRGSLILQKSNPSGLPENDDALEIPVRFE